MWCRCGHGRGAFQSVRGPTLPVCRKTQPHTRTLGNFPEHLTYQVVSGIRLCNRDTNKRTAGSVGFAVLSEATPTSTLTPSKRSMSSSKIIGALLHAYASIVGVFAFATLPKPSCTRKRCADAHAHALRLCIHVAKSGPAWSEHVYMFSVVWIADGLPTRHEELQ